MCFFRIAEPGLMKMRKGEQMNYPSDLAPLAPFRGEGPGGRGFKRVSLHRNSQYVRALCPLIPSPSPPQRGRAAFIVGQDLSWRSLRIACSELPRAGPGLRLFETPKKLQSKAARPPQLGGSSVSEGRAFLHQSKERTFNNPDCPSPR